MRARSPICDADHRLSHSSLDRLRNNYSRTFWGLNISPPVGSVEVYACTFVGNSATAGQCAVTRSHFWFFDLHCGDARLYNVICIISVSEYNSDNMASPIFERVHVYVLLRSIILEFPHGN